MRGVLNTNTGTVHKQQTVGDPRSDADFYRAECGSLSFISDDCLEITSVEGIVRDDGVSCCGRCFEGAGGY